MEEADDACRACRVAMFAPGLGVPRCRYSERAGHRSGGQRGAAVNGKYGGREQDDADVQRGAGRKLGAGGEQFQSGGQPGRWEAAHGCRHGGVRQRRQGERDPGGVARRRRVHICALRPPCCQTAPGPRRQQRVGVQYRDRVSQPAGYPAGYRPVEHASDGRADGRRHGAGGRDTYDLDDERCRR